MHTGKGRRPQRQKTVLVAPQPGAWPTRSRQERTARGHQPLPRAAQPGRVWHGWQSQRQTTCATNDMRHLRHEPFACAIPSPCGPVRGAAHYLGLRMAASTPCCQAAGAEASCRPQHCRPRPIAPSIGLRGRVYRPSEMASLGPYGCGLPAITPASTSSA